MGFTRILAAIVVGSTLLLGCSRSGAPLSVPLVHRPSRMLDTRYQAIKGSIRVKVLDERAKKDAIGQNIERAVPQPILTSDDPTTYIKNVLTHELQMRGAVVVGEADKADRQIVLNLVTFWTDESTTYRASVVTRAEILSGGGRKLWEGMVGGSGSSWGRSLNPKNYQEAFSDATTTLVASLLAEPQAARALSE